MKSITSGTKASKTIKLYKTYLQKCDAHENYIKIAIKFSEHAWNNDKVQFQNAAIL